jgi:hypothetical protein
MTTALNTITIMALVIASIINSLTLLKAWKRVNRIEFDVQRHEYKLRGIRT